MVLFAISFDKGSNVPFPEGSLARSSLRAESLDLSEALRAHMPPFICVQTNAPFGLWGEFVHHI